MSRLTDIGALFNYPISLKQLDLSHNEIEHWPTSSPNWEMLLDEPLSPVSSSSSTSSCCSAVCYAAQDRSAPKTPVTPGLEHNFASVPCKCDVTCCNVGRKFHKTSKLACSHRRHHRLENLRTLVLGDNLLTNICLWLEDGNEEEENHLPSGHKSKLLFPNLGALDLSNNRIREIPSNIHELNNLSVLNLSGNSGNSFIKNL